MADGRPVGDHSINFSTNPEADRAFFKNLLRLDHVDVCGGWLIVSLPPSGVAFHPSDENDHHELYLMVDDVRPFIAKMNRHAVACSAVQTEPWGHLTHVALPGGARVRVYEALHERPGQG